MPVFLFDVIKYIKYAAKRYMRDCCLHYDIERCEKIWRECVDSARDQSNVLKAIVNGQQWILKITYLLVNYLKPKNNVHTTKDLSKYQKTPNLICVVHFTPYLRTARLVGKSKYPTSGTGFGTKIGK